MFDIHVRAMSFVKRWQIAPNTIDQNLSDHSYFVALYTLELASMTKWTPEEKLVAVKYAMTHDLAEIRTGDIPSPVKAYIDKEKFSDLEATVTHNLMGDEFNMTKIVWGMKSVVKVADMIDEVMHMAFSVAMGNVLLKNQLHQSMLRFELAARAVEVNTLLNSESIISNVYKNVDSILAGDFHLPMKEGIDS